MKLSDRVFKCDNCGFSLNRDENAAINLNNFNPAAGRSVGGNKSESLLELSKTQSNLGFNIDGKNFSEANVSKREQTTLN